MPRRGMPGMKLPAPRGTGCVQNCGGDVPCTNWIFSSSVICESTQSARTSALAVGGGEQTWLFDPLLLPPPHANATPMTANMESFMAREQIVEREDRCKSDGIRPLRPTSHARREEHSLSAGQVKLIPGISRL